MNARSAAFVGKSILSLLLLGLLISPCEAKFSYHMEGPAQINPKSKKYKHDIVYTEVFRSKDLKKGKKTVAHNQVRYDFYPKGTYNYTKIRAIVRMKLKNGEGIGECTVKASKHGQYLTCKCTNARSNVDCHVRHGHELHLVNMIPPSDFEQQLADEKAQREAEHRRWVEKCLRECKSSRDIYACDKCY